MKTSRPFMKINRLFMKINRLFRIMNNMLQQREQYDKIFSWQKSFLFQGVSMLMCHPRVTRVTL